MSSQGGGLERMENILQADSLLSEYRFFLERYKSLSAIESTAGCLPVVASMCASLASNLAAMKAITGMFTASHIDFDRALFCSWFCLVQARALGLNEQHQRTLFNAGLLQDIGKYVVDGSVPAFIRNMSSTKMPPHGRHDLSDAHPLLASSFIERHFPDDLALRELVLHHHASADGTGYPSYVVESQLGLDDQLLIVANELSDRIDDFGCYDDIDKCLPFIKVASLLYFTRAHQMCFKVLASSLLSMQVKRTQPARDVSATLAKHAARASALQTCLNALIDFSADLLRYDFDLLVRGIRSGIERLVFLSNETGILCADAFAEGAELSDAEIEQVENLFYALPESMQRFRRYLAHLQSERQYDLDEERVAFAIHAVDHCLKKLSPPRGFTLR